MGVEKESSRCVFSPNLKGGGDSGCPSGSILLDKNLDCYFFYYYNKEVEG